MNTLVFKAILSTLVYHDIFDYPLTMRELTTFLITDTPVREKTIVQNLTETMKKNKISNKNGFYFLSGREGLAKTREKRQATSLKKWKIAKRIAGFLKLIPTLKLVGVSGSLAMNNAGDEEDIDFFFITKSGWLWTSRFLVTVFLWLMGVKRKPNLSITLLQRPGVFFRGRRQVSKANVTNVTSVKDKICPNIFLDEDYLVFPKEDRNLYTAHEIVQAKLLWSRDKTYERFLAQNDWVKKFLANTKIPEISPKKLCSRLSFPNPIEGFLKKAQTIYMTSRRTTEKIEPGRLFFHPKDQKKMVLRRYFLYLNPGGGK